MRRDLAAVGATLTASGCMLALAGLAAAATPQTTQANAALRYLYGQVRNDGSVGGSLGTTEDTVISVADNGDDPATLHGSSGTTAYHYLSSQAATITTAGGAAKYVLAWVAAGRPAAFDGGPLLTKLNTPTASGGYLSTRGTFHNGDSSVEVANVYSQALAVLADHAAGHALPAHAAGWLQCAQRPDGGFGYTIDDSASTPPSFCGDSTSDTNSTAIALQGLAAGAVSGADPAARTYLHTAQRSDGGFGFGATDPSDPDSDTTVIQALVAIGEDPSGPSWTVSGGGTPLRSLDSFRDPKGSGGYVYPGAPGPTVITTAPVPQALALKPYGTATTFTAGSTPPQPPATSPPPPSPTPAVPAVPDTGGASSGPAGPTGSLLVAAGAGLLLAIRGRRREVV